MDSLNLIPIKNACKLTRNPRKVIMLGAIHNGHNVIAKFHQGTNRGSINDLPDDAYLCLCCIDKRQISSDALGFFQLSIKGPFIVKKGTEFSA